MIRGRGLARAVARMRAVRVHLEMRLHMRGAYGDLARNLDELVECDHEGSGGSASSSAKDRRETNFGSKGDLS